MTIQPRPSRTSKKYSGSIQITWVPNTYSALSLDNRLRQRQMFMLKGFLIVMQSGLTKVWLSSLNIMSPS